VPEAPLEIITYQGRGVHNPAAVFLQILTMAVTVASVPRHHAMKHLPGVEMKLHTFFISTETGSE
jgi:hypothetical protein